jgi:hypothetical protein
VWDYQLCNNARHAAKVITLLQENWTKGAIISQLSRGAQLNPLLPSKLQSSSYHHMNQSEKQAQQTE